MAFYWRMNLGLWIFMRNISILFGYTRTVPVIRPESALGRQLALGAAGPFAIEGGDVALQDLSGCCLGFDLLLVCRRCNVPAALL